MAIDSNSNENIKDNSLKIQELCKIFLHIYSDLYSYNIILYIKNDLNIFISKIEYYVIDYRT